MPNYKIEIKPAAEKQYLKLDKKNRVRIKDALLDLEKDENPLQHSKIRPLTGPLHGDYRLRIGNWRILITPDFQNSILYVYAILPRGSAYKK